MMGDLKHLLEEAKKLNRKSKEYDDQVELINNQIEKMMEYNDSVLYTISEHSSTYVIINLFIGDSK